MIQEEFKQARQLIQEKRYDEAREILHFIDHPKASEWLAKLETIDPQFDIPTEEEAQQKYIDPWADGSKQINLQYLKKNLPWFILIVIVPFLILTQTGVSFSVISIFVSLFILWVLYQTFKGSSSNHIKQ